MSVLRRVVGRFELVRMSLRGHRFPPHTHDRFVLSLSLSGTERITIDGTEVDLDNDDIGLLNAGEVESSSSTASLWTFVSLYIDANEADPKTWRFDRRYMRSKRIVAELQDLAASDFCPHLSDSVVKKRLEAVLQEALNTAASAVAGDRKPPDDPIRSLERILSDPEYPAPSLKTLAAWIGISTPELVRRFKRRNGLPPSAWSYDKRLHRALHLVEHGSSLAKIAVDLGYSDQAHMTRRFKAAVGVSPAIWVHSKISFNTDP